MVFLRRFVIEPIVLDKAGPLGGIIKALDTI
jgi:hypothetical protein